MTRISSTTARTWRIVAIFVIALTAFVFSVEKPQMAAALSVEGVFFANGADSEAAPTTPEEVNWDIAISFDGNVAVYEGDEFVVDANPSFVHLQYADGGEVNGWHARHDGGFQGKRALYIEYDEPLRPLTRYRVLIDSGVTTADGSESLGKQYVYYFTTTPQIAEGISVFHIALGTIALVAVAAGSLVMTRRRRGWRS